MVRHLVCVSVVIDPITLTTLQTFTFRDITFSCYGVPRERGATSGGGHQVCRISANVFSKKSRTVDKEWPSGKQHLVMQNQHVTKCYTGCWA